MAAESKTTSTTLKKEYKTISRIAGPLIFVKETHPVGYSEIVEVNVKKFKNKDGNYASVSAMDDNFEIGRITVWQEDYERFKTELKKGNLISIQVCPPSNGFPSFTFRSPPRHKRHELPKDKKNDYRLVVLEEKVVHE